MNPLITSAAKFESIPRSWGGGKLRWCWRYLDRDGGEVLGIVARYNLPAGSKRTKVFRPAFVPDGKGGWTDGGGPRPAPLFGLHTLSRPGDLFVVEGERCAAALHSLGLAAVCSPGGYAAADNADWLPLDGVERVIILPDHDEPGESYLEAVAGILAALPHPPEVFRVDLPDLPDKGDVADWLQARCDLWDGFESFRDMTDRLNLNPNPAMALRGEFEEAIREKEQFVIPATVRHGDSAPIPLLVDDPAELYPVDALGDVLGGAAMAIHEAVQAPMAMCCNSILAAAALAAQAHADVSLLGIGQRPLSEFFLTVGESGERKSAVDRWALAPVRAYETELRKGVDKEREEYRLRKMIHDHAVKDAQKEHKGDMAGLQEALKALGASPAAPGVPLRVVSDMTIEGLYTQLESGWPALGVFSDEGGTVTGGHGMLPENLLHTLTGFSELWDGKPLARVRKMDGTSVLAGRRVSIHLMMQPAVAAGLLDDAMANGQGFLARCLTVWPESTAGTRLYRAIDPSRNPAMQRYDDRMRALLNLQPVFVQGTRELYPYPLAVEGGSAHELWIAFHDRVETGLRADGEFRPVKGLAGKTPEHAMRLAGILAVFEGGDLDGDRMRRGCVLADFYLREALRIKGVGRDIMERERADRLRRWLQSREDLRFTNRDVTRYGPRELRQCDTAREALRLLESHGWIVRDGGKDRWRLAVAPAAA